MRAIRAQKPDQGQVQDQEHHVPDIHAGDDGPDQLRLLRPETRPGLQAVHHEGAQQHGQRRSGRNAEGQERDELSCWSRRCWPTPAPPPLPWPLARTARGAWRSASPRRRPRRWTRAGPQPGSSPRKKPTAGPADHADPGVPDILPGRQPVLDPGVVDVGDLPLDVHEELAEGEEADDHGDEVHAGDQRRGAEGEAGGPRRRDPCRSGWTGGPGTCRPVP